MIARKKRKIIIITNLVFLILILLGLFIYIYIYTDIFKSNATLFGKYISQNVENIEKMSSDILESEYGNLLKENKYTSQTNIKVNYTKDKGTTLENADNFINQLNLKISGQIDAINNYNFQNIKMLKNNEQISEFNYLKDGNTYGIQDPDLFTQYVAINNGNIKDVLKNAGYSEEQLVKIPNEILSNSKLIEGFKFSEEEKEQIITKYTEIVLNNVDKKKFSKQSNQVVEINGKNVIANAYTISLTKEELNNIYIKLFEEMKQDDIILAKIDKIQEVLNQYQIVFEKIANIENQYVTKLDWMINYITQNNIGQDECKIIVYESEKNTVRTAIHTDKYEINLDLFEMQDEKFMEISYTNEENKNIFSYHKNGDYMDIVFQNITDKETVEYSISIDEKINANNCNRNINVKYEDNENKVEMIIESFIQIVQKFENENAFTNDNCVNLSELEPVQSKAVLDRVIQGFSEKFEEMQTSTINLEDLKEVLVTINFLQESEMIEEKGISQTERNRFNSKFEILKGTNIEGENVLNLIKALENNLVELEVVSATEVKLKIDRFDRDENAFATLSDFLENNKDKKYNIDIEYDEGTGLVNNVLLIMIEDKQ